MLQALDFSKRLTGKHRTGHGASRVRQTVVAGNQCIPNRTHLSAITCRRDLLNFRMDRIYFRLRLTHPFLDQVTTQTLLWWCTQTLNCVTVAIASSGKYKIRPSLNGGFCARHQVRNVPEVVRFGLGVADENLHLS